MACKFGGGGHVVDTAISDKLLKISNNCCNNGSGDLEVAENIDQWLETFGLFYL